MGASKFGAEFKNEAASQRGRQEVGEYSPDALHLYEGGRGNDPVGEAVQADTAGHDEGKHGSQGPDLAS